MTRVTNWVGGLFFLGLAHGVAAAQTTARVSVATGGAQGNGVSAFYGAAISADGRFVGFHSAATNLVAGDTNGSTDVFVRDRETGTTERVSVGAAGAQADGNSYSPAISADGRFVAFQSDATNLVAGDTNGVTDGGVRDRLSGTTERVSVAYDGAETKAPSSHAAISADGRYVAFRSFDSGLVAADVNGEGDVFVRDRQNGTTELVSLTASGLQGNGPSGVTLAAISADGRFVAFDTQATNFVASDANGFHEDIFLRDRTTGTTELVDVSSDGQQSNGQATDPSISADGRFVVFRAGGTNLVAEDVNGRYDIFLRDRSNGTTELVSLTNGGAQANGNGFAPSISADGRFVTFASDATNLVAADTNGAYDIFVRDLVAGTTERVSVATGGAQADANSYHAYLSADGRFVAFESLAADLVAGDTNSSSDIFLRDRDTTGFASLCDPGADGVTACPCSNAAAGPDRGCDNSSATGGASLSGAGAAQLSSDSVVFTTSGEKPTALSVLLQGKAFFIAGAIYGQGVRCVGGTQKRLFSKHAAGGSIIAPDFGAGDPPISARSAAKGDTIQAGESRWYLVFYRDAIVLGGCAPTSTFNGTQTRQATWAP